RHNLLEDALEPAHYDLVHCRFVLQHLPEPAHGLRRMAGAVRPGGWPFVEEFDVGSSAATDKQHPRAADFDRTKSAVWRGMQDSGPMDPTFGRRVPALVDGIGVQELGYEGVTLIARGGDPFARFVQMTNVLLKDRFVAAGVLSEADFDELHRDYNDPSLWFVG